MKTPALLILTDRGKLAAYKTTENDSLVPLDTTTFDEGNLKISEIVTDQAGAFPTTGGIATASYESLPLKAELEVRSFRKIRGKIADILDHENPGSWGFAAPSEINGAILDDLDEKYKKKLQTNLKLDLTNSPPKDVLKAFH